MDPVAEYRRTRILTASPGELVVMLYDGMLQRIGHARVHAEAGRWGPAGETLGRAQEILYELMACLDSSQAPELVDGLLGLYTYCSERLLSAVATKDASGLDEVDRLLRPLRDAWVEAARQTKAADPVQRRAAGPR